MSFNLYLQCFDSGEPAGIRRAAVQGLFPVVEDKSEAEYWLVRYDDSHICHIWAMSPMTDVMES
jgi:hypothetical protein